MDKVGKSRKRLVLAVLPQVLLLPVVIWLVWGADIWTGVSLMFPAYIIVALIFSVPLLLPLALVRRPAVAVVPSLWLAFLLALPFVTNSSIKPLLRGARDLEPSMDRDAILRALNDRYDGTSYPLPVVFSEEETRLCIKPQGRDPGFHAESLLVHLEGGRFTRVHFSAD